MRDEIRESEGIAGQVLDLGAEGGEQWAPLVYTTGDHLSFDERFGRPTQPNVIQFLSFDEQNPNSILSCLRAARENVSSPGF